MIELAEGCDQWKYFVNMVMNFCVSERQGTSSAFQERHYSMELVNCLIGSFT